MANKRLLKKRINLICEELFAESIATSLYGPQACKENAEAFSFSVIKMQDHYLRRISHPEPGISAKLYFKDLEDKFLAQVGEILDQINS